MRYYRIISFILTMVILLSMSSAVVWAKGADSHPNTYVNTGNQRKDIIEVAATQLGYREGANNDTKYGDWYGLPKNPWCAMFVSWCANQAGVPNSVLQKSSIASPAASYFNINYHSGSNYTPVPGDLFFTKNFSHVGFVYSVDGNYFYSIEGNSNSSGSNEGEGVVSIRRAVGNYYFGVPKYSNDHALTLRYHANGGTIKQGTQYDQYRVLSSDGINMRSEAGTGHPVVIALPKDTVFTVTKTKEANGYTWGKTEYAGNIGWCVISMNWTELIGKVSSDPYYVDSSGLIYESSTAKPMNVMLRGAENRGDLFPEAESLSLKREGYTFAGWVTAPYEGNYFAPKSIASAEDLLGENLKQSATLDLYAVWMPPTITVQYHAAGGSIQSSTYRIDSNLLYKGEAATPYLQKWEADVEKANGLINAASFGIFKRGHTFKGWGTNPDGGKIFGEDQPLTAEALYAEGFNGALTATLYAIWEPNTLNVQYHINGGVITSETYQSGEGDLVYKKSNRAIYQQKWIYDQPKENGLINPSTFGLKKNGYTCIGWSTTKSGGVVLHLDDPKMLPTDIEPKLTKGSAMTTLYAVWVEASHTHQYRNYRYHYDATAFADGTETGSCSCGATHIRTKPNTKLKDSSKLFSDISENSWYRHWTDYAVTYELLSGTGAGKMQPGKAMTRAEFVQLLANLSKVDTSAGVTKTDFSDVPADAWYASAVQWASERGIVSGMGNGTFAPQKLITREQMCSILSRYAADAQISLSQNDDTSLFTDDVQISSWAKDAVYCCKRAEIISGVSENEFSPRSVATRAAVASMISRFHGEYVGDRFH